MSKKLITFPKISPQFVQDKKGKAISVILKYAEYESIIKEITKLQNGIEKFKQKSVKKK